MKAILHPILFMKYKFILPVNRLHKNVHMCDVCIAYTTPIFGKDP